MRKLYIGVLRGGPGHEHEISLKSGAHVIDTLRDTHNIVDIVIDKNGVWHRHGIPVEPAKLFPHLDIIFNALHGYYGEDGKVQQLLDHHQMPYTGSGVFSSALAMNKAFAKNLYRQHGIKTPVAVVVRHDRPVELIAQELFRKVSLPVIIKPVSGGSSVGISIARDYHALQNTLTSLFAYADTLLVEEYIQGREAVCAVVDGFRGKGGYCLMPLEIDHKKEFYDYDAKYAEDTPVHAPARFTHEEKALIEKYALEAHKALGARHYSSSDFIVHPKRGIYLIETNTLPGLTPDSLLPKALHTVGSTMKEFLEHVIATAYQGK